MLLDQFLGAALPGAYAAGQAAAPSQNDEQQPPNAASDQRDIARDKADIQSRITGTSHRDQADIRADGRVSRATARIFALTSEISTTTHAEQRDGVKMNEADIAADKADIQSDRERYPGGPSGYPEQTVRTFKRIARTSAVPDRADIRA